MQVSESKAPPVVVHTPQIPPPIIVSQDPPSSVAGILVSPSFVKKLEAYGLGAYATSSNLEGMTWEIFRQTKSKDLDDFLQLVPNLAHKRKFRKMLEDSQPPVVQHTEAHTSLDKLRANLFKNPRPELDVIPFLTYAAELSKAGALGDLLHDADIAAKISATPIHAAIMFSDEGGPIDEELLKENGYCRQRCTNTFEAFADQIRQNFGESQWVDAQCLRAIFGCLVKEWQFRLAEQPINKVVFNPVTFTSLDEMKRREADWNFPDVVLNVLSSFLRCSLTLYLGWTTTPLTQPFKGKQRLYLVYDAVTRQFDSLHQVDVSKPIEVAREGLAFTKTSVAGLTVQLESIHQEAQFLSPNQVTRDMIGRRVAVRGQLCHSVLKTRTKLWLTTVVLQCLLPVSLKRVSGPNVISKPVMNSFDAYLSNAVPTEAIVCGTVVVYASESKFPSDCGSDFPLEILVSDTELDCFLLIKDEPAFVSVDYIAEGMDRRRFDLCPPFNLPRGPASELKLQGRHAEMLLLSSKQFSTTQKNINSLIAALRFKGGVLYCGIVDAKDEFEIEGIDLDWKKAHSHYIDWNSNGLQLSPPLSLELCYTRAAEEHFVTQGRATVAFMSLKMESEQTTKWLIRVIVPKSPDPIVLTHKKALALYCREGAQMLSMELKAALPLLVALYARLPIATPEQKDNNIPPSFSTTSTITYKLMDAYKVNGKAVYEGKKLDFKEISPTADMMAVLVGKYLGKYLSGFLNTEGGTLVFGVHDKGRVIGLPLDAKDCKTLTRRVFEFILGNSATNIYPPLHKDDVKIEYYPIKVARANFFSGISPNSILVVSPTAALPVIKSDALEKTLRTNIYQLGKMDPEEWVPRLIPLKTSRHYAIACPSDWSSFQLTSLAPKVQDALREWAKDNWVVTEAQWADGMVKDLKICHVIVSKCERYPLYFSRHPQISDVSDRRLQPLSVESVLSRVGNKEQTHVFRLLSLELSRVDEIVLVNSSESSELEEEPFGELSARIRLLIDFDQLPFQGLRSRLLGLKQFHVFPDPRHDRNSSLLIPGCTIFPRGYQKIEPGQPPIDAFFSRSAQDWTAVGHKDVFMSTVTPWIKQLIGLRHVCVVIFWQGHAGEEGKWHVPICELISTLILTKVRCKFFVCVDGTRPKNLFVEQLRSTVMGRQEGLVFVDEIQWKDLALAFRTAFPAKSTSVIEVCVQSGSGVLPVPEEWLKSMAGNLCFLDVNFEARVRATMTDDGGQQFFIGQAATWANFVFGDVVALHEEYRTLAEETIRAKCDKAEGLYLLHLPHDGGAGGTTVASHIVWSLKTDYCCLQLLRPCASVAGDIARMQSFSGLPVVVLIDHHTCSLSDVDNLFDALKLKRVRGVVFYVSREKSSGRSSQLLHFLGSQLTQRDFVRLIDDLKRKTKFAPNVVGALDDLCRDGRSAAFRSIFLTCLTASEGKFVKIEDYVETRMKDVLDDAQIMMLFRTISVLFIYTQRAVPFEMLRKMGAPAARIFEGSISQLILPTDQDDHYRPLHISVARHILSLGGSHEPSFEPYHRIHDFVVRDLAPRMCKCLRTMPAGATDKTPEEDLLTELVIKKAVLERELDEESLTLRFSALVLDMLDTSEGFARDIVQAFATHSKLNIPAHTHLLAHLARFYIYVAHDLDKAVASIDEAIKLSPDDHILHHIKGMIYRTQLELHTAKHKEASEKKTEDDNEENSIITWASNSFESFKTCESKGGSAGDCVYVACVQMYLRVIRFFTTRYRCTSISDLPPGLLQRHSFLRDCCYQIHEWHSQLISFESNWYYVLLPSVQQAMGDIEMALRTFLQRMDDATDHRERLRNLFSYCSLARPSSAADRERADIIVTRLQKSMGYRLPATETEAQELPYRDQDMIQYFRCVRYSSWAQDMPTIMSNLDLWLTRNGRHEESKTPKSASKACYFMAYVLHALEACDLPGDVGLKHADKAMFYFQKYKETPGTAHVTAEFLAPGAGLERLVDSRSLLGVGKKLDRLKMRKAKEMNLLRQVSGILHEVDRRRRYQNISFVNGLKVAVPTIELSGDVNVQPGPVVFFLQFGSKGLYAFDASNSAALPEIPPSVQDTKRYSGRVCHIHPDPSQIRFRGYLVPAIPIPGLQKDIPFTSNQSYSRDTAVTFLLKGHNPKLEAHGLEVSCKFTANGEDCPHKVCGYNHDEQIPQLCKSNPCTQNECSLLHQAHERVQQPSHEPAFKKEVTLPQQLQQLADMHPSNPRSRGCTSTEEKSEWTEVPSKGKSARTSGQRGRHVNAPTKSSHRMTDDELQKLSEQKVAQFKANKAAKAPGGNVYPGRSSSEQALLHAAHFLHPEGNQHVEDAINATEMKHATPEIENVLVLLPEFFREHLYVIDDHADLQPCLSRCMNARVDQKIAIVARQGDQFVAYSIYGRTIARLGEGGKRDAFTTQFQHDLNKLSKTQ